jgi:CRISPR-associated protein Csx16
MQQQMTPLQTSNASCWFVSRHKGSIDWINTQNIKVDHYVSHLEQQNYPQRGDTVIGNLPVQLIAQLNQQGVRFINLDLHTPPELRGKELALNEIEQNAPSLSEFLVWKVDSDTPSQV